MRKLFLSIFGLLAGSSLLFAQQGTISGKVIEASSGFEVIGGTVLVVETGSGNVTDLDGTYQIKIAPGTYSLEFSYVGFATQRITDVVVTANQVTKIDAALADQAAQLDLGITVTAKAARDNVVALLALQQKAPVVLDGISSAQISQTGDNDVASAVRRVTGVTVEGGKYVYVRGLGDRYSKTTMNGGEIPGLDPNRNTVQMDLFPTNLIDNILVYKTFSPNLPGDFSGGYVDITTKDFPDQLTISASASLGYNTQATFNDQFLSYKGGKTDWLGMDDGTRAVPDVAVLNRGNFPEYSQSLKDGNNATQLANLTNSFDNNWQLTNEKPFMNQNYSLSFGNQKTLFGKPLGFIGALTYQRNFSSYTDGANNIYELKGNVANTESLAPQLVLNESRSDDEVLWGAMLSSTLKLTSNHKIGVMAMHNQGAQQTARYAEGVKFVDDPDEIYQTRTWDYLERSLSTVQLNGKHVFAGANNLSVNWLSSYSLSEQDNPDVRFFTNRYIPEDDRYRLKPSSDPVPSRFYRNMNQYNLDNKLDIALPFNQWSGLKSELKAGLSYTIRDREFRENRFNFNSQSFTFPDGNTLDYFQDANLIQANNEGIVNPNGVYVSDNYDPKNSYDANQTVAAGYLMAELPITSRLRAVTGLRVEKTTINLLTYDTDITLVKYPFLNGQDNLLDNVDLLPSLNLNYEMSETMKLRLAYNKTLARPSFRELAPFAAFDVAGGFITVGNPDLKRTLVDNVDLRWEIFPKSGEMVSVSAFYKNFTNPIERTFNPEAGNTELTWRNVDQASLVGTEIEFRKNLGTFTPLLNPFSVGANFAYIVSRTEIDPMEMELIRADDPNAKNTREMFGQAPYVANFLLSFKNQRGTQANASFNVVGERISLISVGATPDYYQQPMPMLNFNISQEIANGLTVKLSANNLLNSEYREIATYKGQEYPIISYLTGRTFSFGLSYNLAN